LKAFLWFWLLSNAEVALQHCSATKIYFVLAIFILGGHNSQL